jgi:hypothetical protein
MPNKVIGNGNNPGTYTFNAAAKTVTFSGVSLKVQNILNITNLTQSAIIYNPFVSGTGFTAFANNVLTLVFDTTTHNNSDVLLITYNDDDILPVEVIGELTEAIEAMRMAIVSLTRSVGLAQVNPLTGRLLVDQSALTQTVSGTVSANQSGTWNITNLTQVGGANAAIVPLSLERGTADNLRRNINVT